LFKASIDKSKNVWKQLKTSILLKQMQTSAADTDAKLRIARQTAHMSSTRNLQAMVEHDRPSMRSLVALSSLHSSREVETLRSLEAAGGGEHGAEQVQAELGVCDDPLVWWCVRL
jgi:hypothetical protein